MQQIFDDCDNNGIINIVMTNKKEQKELKRLPDRFRDDDNDLFIALPPKKKPTKKTPRKKK